MPIFRLAYLFKKNFQLCSIKIVANFSSLNQGNQQRNNDDNSKYGDNIKKFALITGVSLAFGVSSFLHFNKDNKDKDKKNEKTGTSGSKLPSYKMSEVNKHKDKASKIWTTYRDGVYDITEYVDKHPGGDVVMVAAGGSLDPYWALYEFHKKDNIIEELEKYRIGNLVEEDVKAVDAKDIWANEPLRHPSLITRLEKPYNLEPQAKFLVEKYYTPNEIFFVRSHHPVPNIDADTYKLEVTGIGIDGTKTFTLKELKDMPRCTINSTLMCCGNRRKEMSKVKKIDGLIWGFASVGNAEWTGVKLCDFLNDLDICEYVGAEHVKFEGYDRDVKGTPFGSSIPLLKALDPRGDVLLAYEMNGEPLSRDHGFPLRLLVPGVAGARSVKWLNKITLSEEESDCHYYASEYKGFSPNVNAENVDFSTAPAVQELPIMSAICVPYNGHEIEAGTDLLVKGYAYVGGGRKIIRVDLTCNKGKTWYTAKLLSEGKKPARAGENLWDWTLWEVQIPVTEDLGKEFDVQVKAVDNSYSTQPECFRNIWNFRGVANVAYHKVRIKVKEKPKAEEVTEDAETECE